MVKLALLIIVFAACIHSVRQAYLAGKEYKKYEKEMEEENEREENN